MTGTYICWRSAIMIDIIQHIRERIRNNRYEISLHAERERENDNLLVSGIEESVLLRGEKK